MNDSDDTFTAYFVLSFSDSHIIHFQGLNYLGVILSPINNKYDEKV